MPAQPTQTAQSSVTVGTGGATTVRLFARTDVPAEVSAAAVARISAPDARDDLRRLMRALQATTVGHAIGRALDSLPDAVVEDTPDGEAARAAAGLVPVRLSDLDARASDDLLAYVGVVLGVLVLLIPSTAIEADLPPHVGDRTRAPRNGATELLLETVVSLPALAVVAAPRLDRLLRRAAFQGLVLDALRQKDVILWTDSGKRDLNDTTQMTMTTMEASIKGDADAISRKSIILGGRVGILDPGKDGHSRRDFNWQMCPFGFGPVWRRLEDGTLIPEKKTLQVRDDEAPLVQAVWTAFAEGKTYAEIAEILIEKKYRVRGPKRRLLADLPRGSRINVVHRLVSPAMAELHRTGTWVKDRSTAAPIREVSGRPLQRGGDGRRHVTVTGRLPVHLIGGRPWGVSEETWEKVAERHAAAAVHPREAGKLHGAMPFSTTAPYREGQAWFRVEVVHTTLQLRRYTGPAGIAGSEPGQDAPTSLVAACNQRLAARALGTALAAALLEVGARTRELTLSGAAVSATVVRLRGELAAATAAVEEATHAAGTEAALAAAAGSQGATLSAAAHLREEENHRVTAAHATARVDAVRAELAEAVRAGADERADLSRPVGVAAALIRWGGDPDPRLRAALAELGLTATLRLTFDAGTGSLSASATATLTLTDGTPTTVAVLAALPNTSTRRARAGDVTALLIAWAGGASLTELGTRFGRRPAWVRETLAAWFAAHGVTGRVGALLECPIPATRAAVLSGIDPAWPAPPGMPAATVALLTAAYTAPTGSWPCWTGYCHAPDQRLLAALSAAGGHADLLVLRAAAGADPGHLACSYGGRPAIATVPSHKRRALRACPHPDCGHRWADHVLYTPETAGFGVICPACRRLPDPAYADAPLPPGYEQAWERVSHDGSYHTVPAEPTDLALPDPDLAAAGGDLVRVKDAAAILSVLPSTVTELAGRGQLTPLTFGTRRLYRASEVTALATRRARRSKFAIKDGWLSPEQVAALKGVSASRVRQYCRDGLLAYRSDRSGGSGSYARRRIHPDVAAAFTVPAGDLTTSLTYTDAARHTGLPTSVITRATKTTGPDRLPTVLTSTGKPMITPEALETWLREHPPVRQARPAAPPRDGRIGATGLYSISAAARYLGTTAKRLRHLADTGTIPTHHATDSQWRWFTQTDLDAVRHRA